MDGPSVPKDKWAAEAFHKSWETFSKSQTELADEGRRRFLARFEYPSLWETQEMYDHRMDLYNQEASTGADAEDDEPAVTSEGLTCEDHDLGKERATVTQYVAIVGEEVAINLEGLACARVDKPKKQRETDAHVQEAYMKLTSGGGQGDGDVGEDGDAQVAGPTITSERHSPPIQWEFSTDEDMQALLAFENK